ncbi:Gp37-like protein [Corynebacterium provencense]|uniref:Gp37-like protein n=1 Tax=Corynebacterium provencense TaxID=1737425 RepID=UPI0008370435|nr:hypothetical protein [Corynebacterium provencense]
MTTMYNTAGGPVEEPLSVELVDFGGRVLGHVGAFEEMLFTFVDRAADVSSLRVPLTELTARLLPCDGRTLIAMRYNGLTHLTVPVDAKVVSGDDPTLAMLEVTGAGGWTLLDGQVLPPGLADGLTTSAAEFEVTGPLETVIKRLVTVGTLRVSHPVYVTPDQGRGPEVTARGAWVSVGDAVRGLLTGTGYRLEVTPWVPGDQPITDQVGAVWPFVAVDVVPYRRRPGLVWSSEGGDIASWEVSRSRATMTRVVASNGAEDVVDRYDLEQRREDEGQPWWAIREGYRKVQDPAPLGENGVDPFRVRENLEVQAAVALSETAASESVSVKINAGTHWQLGAGEGDGWYRPGDLATVVLPLVGTVEEVITEVEVKITPSELTVTPTVGTPDSTVREPVADMARRIGALERE